MTSPEETIARVTAEMTAGRLWRAREILAGRIAGGDAAPAILEAHGRVLQAMGEQVEAGRYLFASGVRAPAYADAIALFTRRHGSDTRSFFSQLPPAVRRQRFTDLPPSLQEDLRAMNVSTRLFGKVRIRESATMTSSWRDRVIAVFGFAVLVLFLAALGVGLVTIMSWAVRVIFGR